MKLDRDSRVMHLGGMFSTKTSAARTKLIKPAINESSPRNQGTSCAVVGAEDSGSQVRGNGIHSPAGVPAKESSRSGATNFARLKRWSCSDSTGNLSTHSQRHA